MGGIALTFGLSGCTCDSTKFHKCGEADPDSDPCENGKKMVKCYTESGCCETPMKDINKKDGSASCTGDDKAACDVQNPLVESKTIGETTPADSMKLMAEIMKAFDADCDI